jgi:hypothetical protein
VNYRIDLSRAARETLLNLPDELRVRVGQKLLDLGVSPTTLGHPAKFPYPPTCQIYEFDVDLGQETWDHFSIHFRYGGDEQSLIVLAIGRVNYECGPWEWEPPDP